MKAARLFLAARPYGCHECAWGKVAGCWRCGSRIAAALVLASAAACGGSDEPESRDTANPPQCAASAGACV